MEKATKIPLFRRCVIQNFPFIEEDFDALTDYGLLCKVVEYLNKVINQTNINSEQVSALSVLFNQLKDYVDHYFDNLDLQEEVNNKLDEMAESGELAEIISQYLNSTAIFGYDNVAAMKAAENLVDGSYASTLGYYTKNDGGAGLYKIRTKTIYDDVDENKIIAIGETLVAELINNSTLPTKLGVNLWTRGETLDDVKDRIDNYKFMGVTDIVIVIQLDGDNCTVTEDIDVVNGAIAYAVSKNITVNTIKFHCTNSLLNSSAEYRALYQQHCDDLLQAITGTTITRVITLNERNGWFNNNATDEEVDIVRNMVAHYKSLGYQVSVSVAGLRYFMDCYYFHPEVTNSFDFIAVNDYPVVGYNDQFTSEKEIKEAFSTFYNYATLIKSLYPNKDFILSEIGVQNVWQSLRSPANWRIAGMAGVTNSEGKIIPLYFSGLLDDPRMSKIFSEVWLWYSEYYYQYPEQTKIFRNKFVGEN